MGGVELLESMQMIIRFVRGTAWESTAIALQEKACMPFVPSHVEALSQDGTRYIGAHMDGGFLSRPVGYDAGKIARMPDGYDRQVFPDGLCDLRLDLGVARNVTDSAEWQDAVFYKYLKDSIGEPYDWTAILGFVIPEHFHLTNHAICSAKITLALRKCMWFADQLASPAHLVNPRDLLLMISARMQVPGI